MNVVWNILASARFKTLCLILASAAILGCFSRALYQFRPVDAETQELIDMATQAYS